MPKSKKKCHLTIDFAIHAFFICSLKLIYRQTPCLDMNIKCQYQMKDVNDKGRVSKRKTAMCPLELCTKYPCLCRHGTYRQCLLQST